MTRVRLLRLIQCVLVGVIWITPLRAQQATGTIRGRVVDSTESQPIAGVLVTIGSHRALTQSDGRYLIPDVPAGTDSVRAKVIGFTPGAQSVTIAGGDTVTVDFALARQAVSLAEMTVIGYGSQHAGDLSSAVSQVTAKDFNPGPTVSPQMLIENKVAGVQIIDNNQPGGGLSIRIRGSSSVTASNEPLYVVDGVPLGAGGGISANGNDPLNFLNPDDIATITVLKDAASSAIYGTLASNGVVLITTKSGQGRPRVEYSGSFSASSVTRLPSMLSAAQFRAAVLADTTVTLHLKTDTLLGTANTNWFDLIDRTATGQQQNVALTGAGASNTYRLSLGYTNQEGILKSTNVEKISVGVNYDQRLYGDRLDLQANIRGTLENDLLTPGGVLSNAAQMGPTQAVFDPTSVTGYYNWPGYSLQSANNPVEILNTSADQATTYRSVGNLQGKYDFSSIHPLEGLTGTVNLGYDVTQNNRVTFSPNNIAPQIKSGTLGSYFNASGAQANTLLDMYLDYAPPSAVGPGSLDVTGGYSYSQSNASFPGFGATQLGSNLLGVNGIPQGILTTSSPNVQDSKLISFFGRASYNINDRYLATVSLRHDGSSRFGPGNQWGNFPAASVGWRISQEPFMSSIPTISDLKLRASWGKTGNQNFGNYLQFSTYSSCNPQAEVQLGNQFVCPFRPSAVDPNIQWEATNSYDLGLDYGIMHQRITGSIDWYKKNTSNLIFTVPVAAGSNLSNFVTTNIGSMTNNGLEFSISARLLDGAPNGGLSWTTDFNAAHNTNELTSINPNAVNGQQILVGGIAGGVGSTIQVLEPGQPINSFFVCQQVYSGGKPVQGTYVNQAGGANVTSCQTANERAFHDPAPKWILGFTSSMTYHHFDFSFTLRAWIGNYVYNNIASNLGDYQELERGDPFNLSTSVLQTGFTSPQYLSDYYVENGSFLRLDDITVGYTFPWRAQQLRLFVNVQDAFTITGYSGVDPTAGLNGIDNNLYPRARTVTSGLSVQF